MLAAGVPKYGSHSVTGVSNTDDYLARLMKGCIQLKKAPRMRNVINACPVDFVAQSIVHIASTPANFGKCFHYFQPKVSRRCMGRIMVLFYRDSGVCVCGGGGY